MILVSRTTIWGLRLLVLLPITAACTPHEDPCLGISQPRSCLNEGGGGLSFVNQISERSEFTPNPPEPKHTEPVDHDDHYTGPDFDRDYDDEDPEHEEEDDDDDSSEEADNDDSKQEHHDVSRRSSS